MFIDVQFNLEGLNTLLTIFVIADSLISLGATYTMTRPALVRSNSRLWNGLFLMWIAVILVLVEVLIATPPFSLAVLGSDIFNPLAKTAIIFWIIGVGLLLLTAYRIFTLDFIKLNKSVSKFDMPDEKTKNWGISLFNQLLKSESKRLFYPVVIYSDEYSRPWQILQRFTVSGLTYQPKRSGVIYFTFGRAADEIVT